MARKIYTIFILVSVGLTTVALNGCAAAKPVPHRGFLDSWSQSAIHNAKGFSLRQAGSGVTSRSGVRRVSFDLVEENEEPAALSERSNLEDYLVYAALNNPGLEAAFYRWKAALERIEQVSTLPDPRFTYRFFIREVETRVGPQNQGISLSQTFPWPGKLSLRGHMASEIARAAKAHYDVVKLKLFHEVKDAYFEYYYLGRAITIAGEHRDLVSYLEGVALTRYKAGIARQSEVIRAQVELGKLEDHWRSLTDLQGAVVARLNSVLNRAIDQELPFPTSVPHRPIDIADPQIVLWLGETNPDLIALDHNIVRQRKSIELASKNFYPDLSLGINFTDVGSPPRNSPAGFGNPAAVRSASRLVNGMGDAIDVFSLGKSFSPGSRPNDEGKDVWMLTLSMNLPIWRSKYAAGVREARAGYIAAMSDRKELQNRLSSRAAMVLYRLRDADRKIDLYHEALIPKARQSLKATETAYRASSASFLDLIDAERVLLEFELSYERALSDHGQRLAELEMLVGRKIPLMNHTQQDDHSNPNQDEGEQDSNVKEEHP